MYILEEHDVDINASMLDRHNYQIILDYGLPDGQLYALRSSIRGNMYTSFTIQREVDGSDSEGLILFLKTYVSLIIK